MSRVTSPSWKTANKTRLAIVFQLQRKRPLDRGRFCLWRPAGPCAAHQDAFAGKPCSYRFRVDHLTCVRHRTCRSRACPRRGPDRQHKTQRVSSSASHRSDSPTKMPRSLDRGISFQHSLYTSVDTSLSATPPHSPPDQSANARTAGRTAPVHSRPPSTCR